MEERWILHDNGCEGQAELGILVPFQPSDWLAVTQFVLAI